MTQTERIRYYENLAEQIEDALCRVERTLPLIRELEAYYAGPLWKEDYAADEAGMLPADLRRGVLSQDGIYNLLERCGELLRMPDQDSGGQEEETPR